MKSAMSLFFPACFLIYCFIPCLAPAAYHHMGESDTPKFLLAYPDKAGTKLDNCVLCHSGGSFSSSKGKKVELGSCQWCHHTFGYDGKGDVNATLNRFGKEYRANGRNVAAFKAIETLDSDDDGYSNIDEIVAVRYPGDPRDDPEKVVASYRIFSRAQLMAMPQHSQFLLMNTAKAVDSYAEFSGVTMEYLLGKAGIDSTATKITVYSPDGYSQGHPLEDDGSSDPFVKGAYPVATYYYDKTADKDKSPTGWCDYSSPAAKGFKPGTPIHVKDGLKLLVALRSKGRDLAPGRLGPDNILQKKSQGPFYVVAPQKTVGPPDQPSSASRKDVIWPYDQGLDHNGGFSTKCATIIKAGPLPAGTTDIDVTEAGWSFIDQEKIIIYGALQGPKLKAPENGAGKVSWNPARFFWEKSPGVETGDVITYQLEYTKDDPTLRHWQSVSVQSGKISAENNGIPKDSDTSPSQLKTTLVLQPNTTYHWRVRDRDKNGGTTVSAIRCFTTGD